ncbi:MAG: hypothetical protein AB7V00_01395 [Bacilli bacterium]
MRILLLFATLLTFAFAQPHLDEFDEAVNTAYSEYLTYDYYENPYYTIKVIYGLVNDKISYGVSFFSVQANEYSLKIAYQGYAYDLPKNNRGDTNAIALNLKEGSTFSLIVYDYEEHVQSLNKFQDVEVITMDTFNGLGSLTIGEGQGVKLVNLRVLASLSSLSIFYFSLIFVFLICALILIVFYWRKKGFFDQTIREDLTINEKAEEVKPLSNEFEEQLTINEPKEEQRIIWEDDELPSAVNITKHLQDLGFNIQYQTLSESEKFKVMEELIKLRDQKLVTKDDYLEEIAKLWKN